MDTVRIEKERNIYDNILESNKLDGISLKEQIDGWNILEPKVDELGDDDLENDSGKENNGTLLYKSDDDWEESSFFIQEEAKDGLPAEGKTDKLRGWAKKRSVA